MYVDSVRRIAILITPGPTAKQRDYEEKQESTPYSRMEKGASHGRIGVGACGGTETALEA